MKITPRKNDMNKKINFVNDTFGTYCQDTHRGEEFPMSCVQQTVYALRSPQVKALT